MEDTELAVTNIVLSINHIAFLPIGGLHWGIIILVGQYMGKKEIKNANKVTSSAIIMVFSYMGLVAASFIIIPEFYLKMFEYKNGQDFSKILEFGRTIMIFVALYTFTDAFYIVYAGALKGAGDTKFPMYLSLVGSWFIFVPAIIIGILFFDIGIYEAWIICTIYVMIISIVLTYRFLSGKWKTFDVIGQKEENLLLEEKVS